VTSPQREARRRRAFLPRLAIWGGAGLTLGVALAFLLLNLVARTDAGHRRVMDLTLDVIGKGIQGKLTIQRTRGNLFQGAKIYGLSITDTEGQPFIVADSAFADYDVRTLLSPRIEISRLTLFSPEIYVRKLPGDSLWNYQKIFRDTVPDDPMKPVVERVVLADTVRIEQGFVRVETPWAPDSTLSPAGQRRMVAEALADTSPMLVRRVRGGYLRTLNVDSLGGRLSSVRFAPGARSGSRIHLDSLNARIQFFRTPFRISRTRGKVALFPDHVEFDAPYMRLNRSPLSASGTIRMDRGAEPAYDIAMRSDSIRFADLRWMYPRFPASMEGALQLLIETRPEGIRFDIREARLRAPGTRIDGRFGMVVGEDTLVFTGVNLVAQPVRVSLIESMLPDGLPVRGLVLGGATIRGTGRASVGPVPADSAQR
jgi:hypothetical protein